MVEFIRHPTVEGVPFCRDVARNLYSVSNEKKSFFAHYEELCDTPGVNTMLILCFYDLGKI